MPDSLPTVSSSPRRPPTRRVAFWLRAMIGVAVSSLLVWWLFCDEDLAAIGRRLADADGLLLVVSAAMITAGAGLRAYRWQLLLRPILPSSSLGSCWQAILIGMMVTNLLPARLGELARPWALSRLQPVDVSGALGTVVLERVLDSIALLILLAAALISPAFPVAGTVMGQPIGDAVVPATLIAGVAVVGVIVLLIRSRWVVSALRLATAWLPVQAGRSLLALVESFVGGLQSVRRPRSLLLAFLWSLGDWLWMAASVHLAFAAFGIELGFTAAVFTTCAVSLFVALPAAPGFLGTLHAGVLVAVHDVFGAPTEAALSLAVGYHLAGFLPVTALGLWYAWTLGLRRFGDGLASAIRVGSAPESDLPQSPPR